jgi:hypothetical protein
MRNTALVALAALAALATAPAYALQMLEGRITSLESTYMPQTIVFQLDVGKAGCPPGALLYWKKVDSVPATYSTMLAALLSSRKVRVYFNDNDTACEGQFFHITASS